VNAAAPVAGPDRAETTETADGYQIRAVKRIDPDEEYLRGHFPGYVLYPGVFFLETLQHAVAEGMRSAGRGEPVLTAVRSARFVAPLTGGDELTLTATLAFADDRIVVKARGHRSDGTLCSTLAAEFREGGAPDA